jgi:hypothetical protein
MNEARSALAEARSLNPSPDVKWLMAHAPTAPRPFDGLRKAGLPQGGPQTERAAIAAASATIVRVAAIGQARTGDDSGSRDAMAGEPRHQAMNFTLFPVPSEQSGPIRGRFAGSTRGIKHRRHRLSALAVSFASRR